MITNSMENDGGEAEFRSAAVPVSGVQVPVVIVRGRKGIFLDFLAFGESDQQS